jgi:hypothetical protein
MLINKEFICGMKIRNFNGYGYRVLMLGLCVLSSSGLFAQLAPDIHTVNDLPAVKAKAYYSFSKGTAISGADTAGKDWDIAFHRTQVWINSGTSGKGSVKALLVKNTSFDKVAIVPATTEFKVDSDSAKAIPAGSGNGWYVYDMSNHSINPAPGRVIIVQTGTGKTVKMEILNYYKNGDGEAGYYTFRYAFVEQAQ